jgi:L-fuculose-phosphate aldolase
VLRADVVDTARAMAADGLVKGSEGNVSAREGDLILITPAGLPYDEMEDADLVTLDLSGHVIAGEREPSSERAVHVAIYGARPDVRAVVHTHSPAVLASPDPGVPVAEYAETGTRELADEVVRALGEGSAVLMARHGLVAVGRALGGALDVARRAESASM